MTEEERVAAEVERRRERAAELGLSDLLTLFYNHLQFLKDGPNHDTLPESVTNVKVANTRSGRDSIQIREIFFGEKSYVFVFKWHEGVDPGGEPDIRGHFLLHKDSQTLFDLSILGKDEEWTGRFWTPYIVEAFIEGPWVQEIRTFTEEVFDLSNHRQEQSQQDTKKKELEDLKKKFGVS